MSCSDFAPFALWAPIELEGRHDDLFLRDDEIVEAVAAGAGHGALTLGERELLLVGLHFE